MAVVTKPKRKEHAKTRNKRVLKKLTIPIKLQCFKVFGEDLMTGAISQIEAHGNNGYTLMVEVHGKLKLEDLANG